MEKWERQDRWILGGFILVTGVFLLFNLQARSLENHDYLRYSEIAREMIRSGDWVVPHLNGSIFIDKPPLLFWLIAIPSSLYGTVTPLIGRLPSALSAWFGVIIMFLWAKKIYGTGKAGLIAGGILFSSYQYFTQARVAKTDMLLCFFILLSLYLFFLGYRESGKRRILFHALSFFSVGLAVLTKGPFGFVIPMLIMAIFLIKERQSGIWVSKGFFLGYAILTLTVLFWVVPFILRVGWDECIALVRGSHILTRRAPFYFYFLQIWAQSFPWALLLPYLFLNLWKRRVEIWRSEESFFLLWFLLLCTFLTLFPYRASRYLLPALPPLALMFAGAWRKRLKYFLVPSLLALCVWHGVEYRWTRKEVSYSPGMILAGELGPLFRESKLFGYRLDDSTAEELNFYLDPAAPIPLLTKYEIPSAKGLYLMSKKTYGRAQGKDKDPWPIIKEFSYKQGKLVLVSIDAHLTNLEKRGFVD